MSDATPCLRLTIEKGVQAGAELVLEPKGRSTLGSAPDRDIVLLDALTPAHALTVDTTGARVVIDTVDNAVSCNGRVMDPGQLHPCGDGDRYQTGQTVFVLRGLDTVAPVPDAMEDSGRSSVKPSRMDSSHRQHRPWLRWSIMTLAVASLLPVSITLVRSLGAPSANPDQAADGFRRDKVEALERALARDGFDDVVLHQSSGETLHLRGYVASRGRLLALESLLATQPIRPLADVFVQADITEQVGDVFRTHGLDATVKSRGPGQVRVVTRSVEPPALQRLEAAARRDVAGLERIETRNSVPQRPAPEPEAAPQARPIEQPGKRVIAVIEGDPGYVVTEDQSKYLVGSSLPTGHRITGIDEGIVVLDLQGHETRLEF